MRYFILISSAIFFAGCSSAVVVNNNDNTNVNKTVNTANNAAANNPLATTKKDDAATANNAPTVAPVVQNYYEALKRKDDAALRKLFSQTALKDLETDMKADKKTSLVEFIDETDLDKPFEVRNEKAEGDKIIAEMRGGSLAVWTPIVFVKENGEWKLSNESPDVQSVRQAANNAGK